MEKTDAMRGFRRKDIETEAFSPSADEWIGFAWKQWQNGLPKREIRLRDQATKPLLRCHRVEDNAFHLNRSRGQFCRRSS